MRVDGEHQHEGADERHDGDEEIFGAVMRDLPYFLEVLGDARDQVAGLVVVVEAERQLLQMVEAAAGAFRFRC